MGELLVAGFDPDRNEIVRKDHSIITLVGKKRDDAIGRSAAKDKIGRAFEYFLEVENRAEGFAHLVEKLEDLRLPSEVLDLFDGRDGGLDREMRMTPDDLVRRDLDLRMPERLVVVVDGFRIILKHRTGGLADDRRLEFHSVRLIGRDLFVILETTLADDDHIARREVFLEDGQAIHEDVIHAPDQLPVL